VPVIEGLIVAIEPPMPLASAHTAMPARPQISIDTSKAAVAQAAVAAGATLVNDVSALRADPEMAGVIAGSGADCCLMHMLGKPRTMQRAGGPQYKDVVDEVKVFLEERLAFAVDAGIPEQRILLDPGIGFGKTGEHNLALLRRLEEIVALGCPVVIGTSRKSFLGGAPADRLPGTIATNVMALERGASVFRVHDVAPVAAALAVASATLSGKWTASPTTS
jgi:dihydropteroate synthase